MNKLVIKSKDNKMIFHPGYLIKNIMDEEGKDTKGMVQLLGLTEKEITSLINAEISITDDMIDRIVKNYGTSKELWKNFQNKYDLKIKELKENSVVFNFERENEISSDIANNILNNVSERLIIAQGDKMEFKKYILKKFDYNVNVSNKKFYTPDETIKQKLGINVKFLKDRKNMLLTFKIDMIDNDDINILKLKVKYILTLNNKALDINESFIKKILSKFYPIFSKFILNFYNSIGLNNIQLPEF